MKATARDAVYNVRITHGTGPAAYTADGGAVQHPGMCNLVKKMPGDLLLMAFVPGGHLGAKSIAFPIQVRALHFGERG